MRPMIVVAVAILLAVPAHADTMAHCSAGWKATQPSDKAKTTYAAYSKICLAKGYTVPAPAMGMAVIPVGATGQCNDGTYTMAKNHQGACSSHGGVKKWM